MRFAEYYFISSKKMNKFRLIDMKIIRLIKFNALSTTNVNSSSNAASLKQEPIQLITHTRFVVTYHLSIDFCSQEKLKSS